MTHQKNQLAVSFISPFLKSYSKMLLRMQRHLLLPLLYWSTSSQHFDKHITVKPKQNSEYILCAFNISFPLHLRIACLNPTISRTVINTVWRESVAGQAVCQSRPLDQELASTGICWGQYTSRIHGWLQHSSWHLTLNLTMKSLPF